MATGIVGTINGSGSVSYTPSVPAKVSISAYGSSGVTVNGASIITDGKPCIHWVGANQTLTVTSSGSGVIVSALES